ncbi:hypothetical protein [Natrinema longum]|uniref:Uncharacterized protein n=1 Tax=Natrinema longum TaxID=370324 RepID=A0A8A2U8D7_9EURY|nr:hypothetical protein [Natrinema longum]MBZ6494165.1 hypothetical protein [Natrinema longum]QSW84505.1 hypothetical protein J0X27_13755 [Natrinema longum]
MTVTATGRLEGVVVCRSGRGTVRLEGVDRERRRSEASSDDSGSHDQRTAAGEDDRCVVAERTTR